MEIGIKNIGDDENILRQDKCIRSSKNNIFQKILDQSKKDIKSKEVKDKSVKSTMQFEKERVERINKIIESSEAKRIDEIAKSNICSGDSRYFEKDGTLNVRDYIVSFGDNISDNDLNEFQSDITGLWQQGLINDDNYFYGLKWIEQRNMSRAVKNGIQNKENNIIDNLVNNTLED